MKLSKLSATASRANVSNKPSGVLRAVISGWGSNSRVIIKEIAQIVGNHELVRDDKDARKLPKQAVGQCCVFGVEIAGVCDGDEIVQVQMARCRKWRLAMMCHRGEVAIVQNSAAILRVRVEVTAENRQANGHHHHS